MKPGVYIDSGGLLFCGQTEDGGLIVVKAPLSLDELEEAGQRIVEVARRLKEARHQAVAGGEKPRLIELRRGAAWN
jgi:hypothetical protein